MPLALARTGINLWFGTANIEAGILNTLATRYDQVWLQAAEADVLADPSTLTGPADFSVFGQHAATIRGIDPTTTVGFYVGGIASPDVRHPPYSWLSDDDMLHRLDGSAVELLPSNPVLPGERRMRVINYDRAATRAYLIDRWVEWFMLHNMQMMLFDTFSPQAYAAFLISLGCPTGALEGDVHTELWWAQRLSAWTTELTAALAPHGYECWINGLDEPGVWLHSGAQDASNPIWVILGDGQTRVPLYATGALSESAFPQYIDPTHQASFITQAGQVSALGGRVFWFVTPQTFDYYYPPGQNPYSPVIPSMARFYLAGYLLIADAGSSYGYHDKTAYRGVDELGNQYVFDSTDWDLEIGPARSGVSYSTTSGVQIAQREYELAWVVQNASTSYGTFTVQGNYRNWHPTTGELFIVSADSPGVRVPPKTGLLLFKQPAVLDWDWRRTMRARLQEVVQDTDGDVQTNRAVTVYEIDGVTPIAQTMYTAASGGSIVTAPQTDSLGRLTLYTPLPQRVKLTVSGVAGQYESEFTPDWTATDTPHSGRANTLTGPGTTTVLTINPTTGGASGNLGLDVKNADGTFVLRTRPHGLSGVEGSVGQVAVQVSGLVFSDANNSPRLFGDLSSATASQRLMAQSSVTNGNSDFGIVVNGAGTRAAVSLYARSTPNSSEIARLYSENSAAGAVLETTTTGGLTAQGISIRPGGTESLHFYTNGDITQADGGHATTDAAGFFYVASCAGGPSGVPTARTGLVPIVFDRTNFRFYAWMGGAWKVVQLA